MLYGAPWSMCHYLFKKVGTDATTSDNLVLITIQIWCQLIVTIVIIVAGTLHKVVTAEKPGIGHEQVNVLPQTMRSKVNQSLVHVMDIVEKF